MATSCTHCCHKAIVDVIPVDERDDTRIIPVTNPLPPDHAVAVKTPQNDVENPLPPHWQNTFPEAWAWIRPILELAFRILIMVSFGKKNLRRVWRTTHAGDEKFTEFKDRIASRISTMTVVAGLLLSSTVGFVTTTPPLEGIIRYTTRGPYLCLLGECGLLLGGIVVGSADIFVMGTCTAKWTRKTLMGTRTRLIFTLVFLAYPFFAIGLGTVIMTFGLVIAAWLAEDRALQIGSIFLLLVPASLTFMFILTQIEVPAHLHLAHHHVKHGV